MTRTRITTDQNGSVTIVYESAWSGERIERTFICPMTGGYVEELRDNGSTSQVCERLASTGNTLRAGGKGRPLADVIRREYKRMRREEQRQFAEPVHYGNYAY